MAWMLTRNIRRQNNASWAERVFLSDRREITYSIVILLPICGKEADGDGGEKIKKYFFEKGWQESEIKARRKGEVERRVLLTRNFGIDAKEFVSNMIFMVSFRETLEFCTNKNISHDMFVTVEDFFKLVDARNTVNADMETSPKQDLMNYELATYLEGKKFIISSNEL